MIGRSWRHGLPATDLPKAIPYRVDGRTSPPWDEAKTYRCKCGAEMQRVAFGWGKERGAYACPSCDRLLVLDFERQIFAWYAPEGPLGPPDA